MSIYVTGDTHGFSRDYYKVISILNNASKDDVLIIAGDFGCVWNDLDFFEGKYALDDATSYLLDYYYPPDSCTILFVDGNHENHVALAQLPEVEIYGGRAHKVTNNIYHLMRGEIYTIEGKTILTLGGALSIDKRWRKEGESWWPQELITEEDISHAENNLALHDYTVDYVITHTAPISKVRELSYLVRGKPNAFTLEKKFEDKSSLLLEQLAPKIKFKKWYFGHFHNDTTLSDNFRCLYDDIVEAKD